MASDVCDITHQAWHKICLQAFYVSTPSTNIRCCLKKDIFLLWFGLPTTRIRWKRLPKTHLFKNALQSGDFLWRRLLLYVWIDENGGFRIRWCHASYTNSTTLSVFLWSGENDSNTLRFWQQEKKIPFSKYRDKSEWRRNLVYTHASCCKYASFYTQRSSGSFWLSLLCHAFSVLASGRDIFINWGLLLQVNL